VTPLQVLFLCTGNSARSIMAEALLNHLGSTQYQAHSAGSHPTGQVNPLAIDTLAKAGVPVGQPLSKNWDAFTGDGAPPIDVVITVCDNAAVETCPVWPGHPTTAHWGFADPAAVDGSETERREEFERVFRQIERCMAVLIEETKTGVGVAERTVVLRDIGLLADSMRVPDSVGDRTA
jgi:arsenate reductase (thioredoxin)